MTTDPASVDLALTVTGLSPDEAITVFSNLPIGSTTTIHVTKPALGPKRYRIEAGDLSVQGAKDVATALHLHLSRVADGNLAEDRARLADQRCADGGELCTNPGCPCRARLAAQNDTEVS